MNAEGSHRPTEPFGPETTPDRSPERSRKKLLKRSFRTRWVPEKSVPVLSSKEIMLFRSSPAQLICVEMLQEGFHRAFSELFSVLRSDRDQRAPESVWCRRPLLEEQQDKLETLRLHLSRAEQAEQTGQWNAVCEERLLLARYFSAPQDLWLSQRFYHSCADTDMGGRSRPATQARAHLTEIYVQLGDLEQARQQASLCLEQAEEGGWLHVNGQPLRLWARRELGNIYSLMADAPLANKDHDTATMLLNHSLSSAQQCGDRLFEVDVLFKLGLTSKSSGDHEAARRFLSSCQQVYGSLQDADRLVKTYVAIAECSESTGNISEAVEYLKKSEDICQRNNLHHRQAAVCFYSGKIYSNMKQHTRACQYFLESYEEACKAGDVALLQKAQVMLGSTCAPILITKYVSDMESISTGAAVARLLSWKETRGHLDLWTDPSE